MVLVVIGHAAGGLIDSPLGGGETGLRWLFYAIYLFQHSIESVCSSADELIEQTRVTLLHEIGHYFGMDEDDLTELGYG